MSSDDLAGKSRILICGEAHKTLDVLGFIHLYCADVVRIPIKQDRPLFEIWSSFMVTVVATIHLLVCFLLIALVLLQDPKSNGGGGVFGGGGSNSLLGATGAVTFLTRLTRYSAIIFGITCIILTLLSRPDQGSVIDSAVGAGIPLSAPAAPAQAPATAPVQAPAADAKAPAQAPATAPAQVPAQAPVTPETKK
jgi:preprotein translocase subunit SecG